MTLMRQGEWGHDDVRIFLCFRTTSVERKHGKAFYKMPKDGFDGVRTLFEEKHTTDEIH